MKQGFAVSEDLTTRGNIERKRVRGFEKRILVPEIETRALTKKASLRGNEAFVRVRNRTERQREGTKNKSSITSKKQVRATIDQRYRLLLLTHALIPNLIRPNPNAKATNVVDAELIGMAWHYRGRLELPSGRRTRANLRCGRIGGATGTSNFD